MKLTWLEDMVKEGAVSETARDAIYKDCDLLVKVAASPSAKEYAQRAALATGEFMQKNQTLFDLVGTSLGMAGLASLKKKYDVAKELKTVKSNIADVRSSLVRHADFSPHQEKAMARFDELVKIAPSVARNPDLVFRILKEKVHSGFSGQDVQNLALIQSSYTPSMTAQMNLSQKVKTASAVRTGESLAAILFMAKEATVRVRTLGQSVENMLVTLAIPLLGGIGLGTVKHLVDSRDKKKMEADLTHSFEQAVKGSDPDRDGLLSNKEKARQAFQILAHFSPHVALQPDAARSFMSKIIHYDSTGRGAVQVEDIKNLSDIQRNHSGASRSNSFFSGLEAGSKALGLDSALKSGIGGITGPLDTELRHQAIQDLRGMPDSERTPYDWSSHGKRD